MITTPALPAYMELSDEAAPDGRGLRWGSTGAAGAGEGGGAGSDSSWADNGAVAAVGGGDGCDDLGEGLGEGYVGGLGEGGDNWAATGGVWGIGGGGHSQEGEEEGAAVMEVNFIVMDWGSKDQLRS